MRSVLACILTASAALFASGVQATEPVGAVALDSVEGKAIARKVVDISQRLGLPNPFAPPEVDSADVSDDGGAGKYLPILTLRERVLRHETLDGRRDSLQWPTHLARGAQAHLRAERIRLLSQLDLDAETRANLQLK